MTRPELQRSLQRFIQTLVILLTLYYTLLGGFAVGIHEAGWRQITYGLTGLLWGVWLVYRFRKKQPWPRTPLDWPLLAVNITIILSTIFSTDSRQSFDSLLLALACTLCFYLAIDLARQPSLIENIIKAILLTALVICGVGLFEYWQWYQGDWLGEVNRSAANIPWDLSTSRRIKSVLNNPNILAYYLLPILGLTLYKFTIARKTLLQLAWGTYLLLILTVIFLTQSRGGLLGAVIVLVIFGGLHFVDLPKLGPWSANRLRASLYLGLGLAAIIGSVLLLWPIFSRTFNLASLNLSQRDSIWRIALTIIGTFPWLGSGPGTFGQHYLSFRQPGSDFVHSHAHNLWLTITAEGGFIGLAALLVLNLAFLRTLPGSLRAASVGGTRGLTIAALAGLSGMTVHNLLDDFLEYPMLTLYVIFLVVLSLNLHPSSPPAAPATSRWANLPNLLALILALLIGAGALWFQPAFNAYDQARTAAAQANWLQAAQYLEQATAADPNYTFYRQQLALVYGKLAINDKTFLPQAIAQQTRLLQRNPHYSLDYANLACLYQQDGNLPAAIQAMEQALALEPPQIQNSTASQVSRLTYQFSLVQLYEQNNQGEAAQELSEQILAAHPWVAASPYWAERSRQLQTLITAIEQAENDLSVERLDTLADLYYHAGNTQRSLTLLQQLEGQKGADVTTLTRLAQNQVQLENFEAALTNLSEALRRDPYNPTARLVRAQVFMLQHKYSEAEADLRVVLATTPTPEAYTIWGQLAQEQGWLTEAKQRYQKAVSAATAPGTDYAYVVWRRVPLKEETLPCLLSPYTPQQLSQPALRLANLLEMENNSTAAAEIYQLLLRYEPYNHLAQDQFNRLCRSSTSKCD